MMSIEIEPYFSFEESMSAFHFHRKNIIQINKVRVGQAGFLERKAVCFMIKLSCVRNGWTPGQVLEREVEFAKKHLDVADSFALTNEQMNQVANGREFLKQAKIWAKDAYNWVI